MNKHNIKDISFKLDLWRKSCKKIVFSNGCFDLFHKGHIDLLKKARSMGDVLIVGLNSDFSVRNLKGKKRPIQDQKTRVSNLLKLNIVDLVLIFEEQTPIKLIKQIQPNIIVKGGDYKKQDVVGFRTIKNWGGRVVLVPLTKGYSTTLIIEKNKF